MMNVFDVASYIIGKVGTITTMKLQKLVYYSQAWSLAWDDKPLFEEDFEAWANGPVCKSLFNIHKGLFSIPDTSIFSKYRSNGQFSKDEEETMDAVIDFYGDKSPNWLSDLTHSELPWIEARGDCKDGDYCSEIINKETMRQYYSGLK
ncbi:MAG: DUF4065 domain-containing protein [Peptostreptococcaceae bacterium]|nr:DUF4065 domain-containing protein [Peptostreptococcaceae bacterium]